MRKKSMLALLFAGALFLTACGGANGKEAEPVSEKTSETKTEIETESQGPEAEGVSEVETETEEKTTVGRLARISTGDEELDQSADQILDEILTDGMTEEEELYRIYTWVEDNVRYSGITDDSDWIAGAKLLMKTRKGNCFGFYSMSRALLTRAGYENLEVHEPDRGHYWNMVKTERGYYHFDTTEGWGTERFLWTDQEILNYTAPGGAYYYYDQSDYPATPELSYQDMTNKE